MEDEDLEQVADDMIEAMMEEAKLNRHGEDLTEAEEREAEKAVSFDLE